MRLLNIKPETPQLNLCLSSQRGQGLFQTFKLNTAGQFTTTTPIRVEFQNYVMSMQLEGHAEHALSAGSAPPEPACDAARFAKTSNGHPNIETTHAPARLAGQGRKSRGVRASLTVAARAHYLANLILQHHFHVKNTSIPVGRGASCVARSGAPLEREKPFCS
jgi:hypothetical protein